MEVAPYPPAPLCAIHVAVIEHNLEHKLVYFEGDAKEQMSPCLYILCCLCKINC